MRCGGRGWGGARGCHLSLNVLGMGQGQPETRWGKGLKHDHRCCFQRSLLPHNIPSPIHSSDTPAVWMELLLRYHFKMAAVVYPFLWLSGCAGCFRGCCLLCQPCGGEDESVAGCGYVSVGLSVAGHSEQRNCGLWSLRCLEPWFQSQGYFSQSQGQATVVN